MKTKEKLEQKIQAIETHYQGIRFRSRLEARWAVFLDFFGIKWIYEHEGYLIGNECYLPDFYIIQHDCFLEIKPVAPEVSDFKKVSIASVVSGKPVILAWGMPCSQYDAHDVFGPDDRAFRAWKNEGFVATLSMARPPKKEHIFGMCGIDTKSALAIRGHCEEIGEMPRPGEIGGLCAFDFYCCDNCKKTSIVERSMCCDEEEANRYCISGCPVEEDPRGSEYTWDRVEAATSLAASYRFGKIA
jgi:hypothetical protein